MTHILAVNPRELIKKVAEELKKQSLVKPPQWGKFVKTGHHQERLPDNEDLWYCRSASIIRKILQQLEKAEFIKQAQSGAHKGRIITPKGTSFLDKMAVQMSKE